MWKNGKEDTVPHNLRLAPNPDTAPKHGPDANLSVSVQDLVLNEQIRSLIKDSNSLLRIFLVLPILFHLTETLWYL
jgi:hypothetical protein